jgi:hypothetical protein
MDSPCCEKAQEQICDKVVKALADHIIDLPPSIERSKLIQKLCTIHPKFICLVSLLH